ncbi:MAG: TatD family hydrolase [Kamptonema sp. SIO4C4]|nr:TatD family hydrolase [Kamptonema sp. SIO4C4]
MQLIDTHVHINFDVFQTDLEALQQRWQEAGVVRLVHSCVEPSEFPKTQALANQFPELFFAVGLHPLDAQKWTDHTAAQIREFALADSRVVAIGELGLDFYKAEDKAHQKHVCQAQLEIASELEKPVIIHCRDAAADLRDILQAQTPPPRGVMHCWGGTPEETQWFLDLGFYISFSGIVTFKNAKAVQESAKIVPRDRLLVETDCPFLAPVPKRGKRNEPANVRYVAETLAQLRQEDLNHLAQTTTANACQLFGLPQPTP